MSDKPRHLSAVPNEADRVVEPSLRPRQLDEYVGQRDALANLRIFIEAAKQRGDALDHLLFHGPPGLGKTSLAHVVAHEMDVQIRVTAGPAIERAGDLVAILTNLEPGDVLFIDEIHRLQRTVEEILYPAMEDFKVDIVLGQGPAARTMTVPLARFTLIGATTRFGLLTGPLRNRFGLDLRLDYYSAADLQQIVTRAARLLHVEITPEGAIELARRARGTPRIVNRLLARARDFAQVEGEGIVDGDIARLALRRLQVDDVGFDKMDRRILETIIDKFDGGPVGIDTLAAALSEESGTIEEVYEPFLIQGGYLQRTPRGRVASRLAYEHLGRPLGKPTTGTLFE